MIIRIVKLEFKAEEINRFLAFFEERKHKIRAVDGCEHLEAWQEKRNPSTVFTCSHWISEAHLETYRQSALFKNAWSFVKPKFAGKPLAWTVEKIAEL